MSEATLEHSNATFLDLLLECAGIADSATGPACAVCSHVHKWACDGEDWEGIFFLQQCAVCGCAALGEEYAGIAVVARTIHSAVADDTALPIHSSDFYWRYDADYCDAVGVNVTERSDNAVAFAEPDVLNGLSVTERELLTRRSHYRHPGLGVHQKVGVRWGLWRLLRGLRFPGRRLLSDVGG